MGFFDDRDDDYGPPPDPFRLDERGEGPRLRAPFALRWLGIAAALLVAFVAASVLKSLYVDLLWFDSVGPSAEESYAGIFRTVVAWRVVLFLGGAAITAAVLGLNIWLALRFAPRAPEESFIEEVDAQAIRRIVTVLLVAATLFLAVIFGSVAGGSWETVLRWLNGVEFGSQDPQFQRDIAFYLFDLPAYHLAQGWVLSLLVVSALASGAVYALAFSLQRFVLNVTAAMRIHLSVLVGLIFLTIAWGTFLSIFDLANSIGGIVYGATYTDVNARLPVRYLLIGLALFAGVVTIANAFLSRGYRFPLFAFGLWAAAGLVGGAIYPQAVQAFTVEPNELEREERFIERNISLTRIGWGLDTIDERSFPALPAVTEEEIEQNDATLDNVRVLDPRPLLDTFNQIQSIRPFYQFTDVDVDRYVIDGVQRQVMLTPRELNVSRALDRNWTRERLQLTHGFGAVVTPVNEVVPASGLPQLLTSDIPPVSSIDELELTLEGSRIYFGELTDHYVVVNTNVAEFDYPLGEGQNAETRYEPDRGIRLSSLVQRMALAWELGDTNLLISGQIGSGSRLLMHRDLQSRIDKVAPFLLLDPDPYLVVEGGRAVLDPGRLHHLRRLPLLGAARRRELHPQQRQGARGRRDGRHDLLPDRRGGSGRPDVGEDLPRSLPAGLGDAGLHAGSPALPGAALPPAGRPLPPVPRDRPAGLLRRRGLLEHPDGALPAAGAAGRPLLRRHEAAGGGERGVRPHPPVHAAQQAEHRGVARRALGRRRLRDAPLLPLPHGRPRLRAGADRGAHRPEPGDLAAAHALGYRGLGGHPRQPAS